MSLCFRQERLLRRTEDALRRSDPHLAAMLVIFSRLGAAEPMPVRERIRTRLGWLRRPLARAAIRTGHLMAMAGHLGAVMLMQSAMAWAAASGSFCRVPPWPDAPQMPGYGAGHAGTERAEREAGAG
jgi:hypothetical protein